jgi:hypothetical protein
MATDELTTELLPKVGEAVIVWTGEHAKAEVLKMMLDARGQNVELIGEHPLEGGELVSALLVESDQVDDVKALIADFESGDAARKG